MAVAVEAGEEAGEFAEGGGAVEPGAGLEAVGAEGVLEAGDGLVGGAFHLAVGVEDAVERAGGDEFRVELLEGAGGGVAGVDEGGLAGLVALLVEAGEVGAGHEDLAADLEERRGAVREAEGDAADGADVLGDVVARRAVAAGQGVVEGAVAVNDADRHAVDLRLDGDGDLGGAEGAGEAGEPVGEARHAGEGVVLFAFAEFLVLQLVDVLDGEHGAEVGALGEAFERGAADALGGGSGVAEGGVGFFQRLQLVHQDVVFGIADLRLGLLVVKAVVPLQLGAEEGGALFRGGGGAGEEVAGVVVGHAPKETGKGRGVQVFSAGPTTRQKSIFLSSFEKPRINTNIAKQLVFTPFLNRQERKERKAPQKKLRGLRGLRGFFRMYKRQVVWL